MSNEDSTTGKSFSGFKKPRQNWSKLPHQFIESLPLFSSKAELCVVLYILRHTWGFSDDKKRITLDEFEYGRKRRNGTRIDNGVGMSKPSIIGGLRDAEKHGFIVVDTDASDTARVKKFYRLSIHEMSRSFTPDVKKLYSGGKETLQRSEKETSERNSKKEKKIAPASQDAASPALKKSSSTVPASVMNPLKDAIAAVFGWDWQTMTKQEKGTVQAAAKSLAEAGAVPPDVTLCKAECERRGWTGYGPTALCKVLSDVRNVQTHKPVIPAPPPLPELPELKPPDWMQSAMDAAVQVGDNPLEAAIAALAERKSANRKKVTHEA